MPKIDETRWQEFWEENQIYRFNPDLPAPAFSIDTPPPTLSGEMHIGHAFSYAQQDFIARYHRMKGENVFYPFGIDDNGLPTERFVEKMKKVRSKQMSRQDFIKLCQQTIEEIKDEFVDEWKKIGMSCDFSNIYSTIDEHCTKTAQKSFIELYKKGLVYRQIVPTMWCVNCQTAIAQAELEDAELPSFFSDIVFKVENGIGNWEDIIISTTRPELLPACVCIFVHPDDRRYAHLTGKHAAVPLFGQKVPIFADESVDPQKGSGIMMVCTYGDRFDMDAVERFCLEPRICITKDGKMNSLAGKFKGLKIKDARDAIIRELEENGLLKAKKEIMHAVNVHDKCRTEIEFLPTPQWFIRIVDHKQEFIDAGNEIRWFPAHMKARYINWVENLNWDWSISRQRHYGVPFPVWYSKKTGEVIIAEENQIPVDPFVDKPKKLPEGHTCDDIEPETDVMDTWMTSSLTPQITTNWITDNVYPFDFKKMFPMSLRPQAHDIIRTWAFYTIVKGMYHNATIPWRDVVISGNVSDPTGEKMSKSRGNVVYPDEVIKKYSADALRYWAASSKLGEDLSYLEKELVAGQRFITKLWNASRFAIMHLQDYDGQMPNLEVMDRWILSKLNSLIKSATEHFENYEYSFVKSELELFFWHDLCDNYLETIKDRLYNPQVRGIEARKSAQYALYHSMLSILKMIAPITPFITEEIYQEFFVKHENKKSIHVSKWPKFDENMIDPEAEKTGEVAVRIISAVRKCKSDRALSLGEEVKRLVIEVDDRNRIEPALADIKAATRAKEILFGKGEIPCDGARISVEF